MATKKPQSANLVSLPVPNFITGVSQQPAHLRLATSVDAMENCWASVVSGVSKRPPSNHLAKLKGKFGSGVSGTIIEKDTNDIPTLVFIADGELYVFDILGNQKSVSFPDGKLYLEAQDPATSFRYLNIQDTTFILNKEKRVKVREFGEINPADYQADGQVYKYEDLPDPNTITKDVVYKTYYDGKFYKNNYHKTVEELNKWVAIGSDIRMDSAPTDYPVVTTVRYNDGWPSGQKVYLRTDHPYSYQSGPFCTNWATYYTYQLYEKVLVAPEKKSYFGWDEISVKDACDAILNDRWDPTNCASAYVVASAGNTRYTIYINGILAASFLTDTNVDANHAMENTDAIAKGLCDGTGKKAGDISLNETGYTWIRTGSTITITNFPAEGLILTTSSQGDTLMKCAYNEVRQFSDLPPQSPHGRMLVVSGDLESGGDDYTVAYNTETRQWEETYWYNRGACLDPDTMPWVLIKNPDGTYTFQKHYWRNRPAGDQDSNPHPRFVNEKLNDMFLYAGRLGFLTNSNIIFSGASHFEQFYRSTVASLQEDDRLDLIVATQNDDNLRHAIAYSRDLLLMADKSQYRFQYNQFLGPKNVQVAFTTSYNVARTIQPINMGSSIFFVDDRNTYRFAKVYEYFPRPNQMGDDAEEITEPVPAYVPAGISFMASSPRTNMLFIGTKGYAAEMFVYKFLWVGDKKAQSAWSKWSLSDAGQIYWAKINRNFLYLLVERSGDVYLERIQIDEQSVNPDTVPDVYLDRRLANTQYTMHYDASEGYTYVTLPYTFNITPRMVVSSVRIPVTMKTHLGEPLLARGNEAFISEAIDTIRVDSSTIKVKGDVTNLYSMVGVPYKMFFTLSTPLVRTQAGSGVTAVLDGRLSVRYFNLEYHRATDFVIRVNKDGYGEQVQYINTNLINDPDSVINQSLYERGTVKAPIMGNNLDVKLTVENEGVHNSVFASGEWWCVYQPRTRRT